MKFISYSHVDDHKALIDIVNAAIGRHQLHQKHLNMKLQARKQVIAAYHAQPWYKKFFSFGAPTTEEAEICARWNRYRTEELRDLRMRADLDLTIELSSNESDSLVRTFTAKTNDS